MRPEQEHSHSTGKIMVCERCRGDAICLFQVAAPVSHTPSTQLVCRACKMTAERLFQ
ncbi:MAG: hypothetical protein RL768_2960 [Nitrospirota bacterium]|jgi:hypothetical protein